MRDQLETAIECLKQEGAIAKLHEKWFGIAPAAGSAAGFPGTGVPDMQGYDPAPASTACPTSRKPPGYDPATPAWIPALRRSAT
jgi:hypothetical protein